MQAGVRRHGRKEQGAGESPIPAGAGAQGPASTPDPVEDPLTRLLRRWGVPPVALQPAVAQLTPLLDWTDAVHLAQAALPDLETHRLLGLRRGELGRLRERERALHALLAPDLAVAAIGLVLRWLVPDTPAAMRTVGGTVIPPGAGLYLAWRMTADRVARVGLREALRLSA